ncbi:hypothetical protein FHW96_000218 [Novosphingobium sp. SG751A]|uniref:hypothetical protein n=1 Tax=Novosphingobium sp. SG751A TaxID=2587000 RepID=UPI001557B7F9|nr:hypothetical protein [Novosphingobium sp. SG751A]NOW44091.1 hypothetical protein [Novosphingobium sp. SG751A]
MARKDVELEAAENTLIEAWDALMRVPDREKGWLRAGERCWWPEIVRDAVTDYKADEAPRRPLSRREVDLMDRVFIQPGALVMMLTDDQRRLLGIVLAHKSRKMGEDGFWPAVLGAWRRLPGNAKLGTTDGLRVRYERALQRLARAGGLVALSAW